MPPSEAIIQSLLLGAALSTVLGVLILGSLAWNPELWLRHYPEPILAVYGRHARDPRTKTQRRWLGSAMLGVTALFVGGGLAGLEARHGELGFVAAFVCAYLMLAVFNLVDLVLIDWLVLFVFEPRWALLPGTEHLPQQQRMRKHVADWVKGSVGLALVALPFAALIQLL